MILKDLSYAPIGQTFGVQATQGYRDQVDYVPATHTFVAPEYPASSPILELPGDYVNLGVVPIDQPNLKTLAGLSVSTLFACLVISMFNCLSRADSNFPLLVFGYHVWCMDSELSVLHIDRIPRTVASKKQKGTTSAPKPERQDVPDVYPGTKSLVTATSKTVRQVKLFAWFLAVSCAFDIIWLIAAHDTWTCDMEQKPEDETVTDPLFCFYAEAHKMLRWTYGIHRLVLRGSLCNLVLKIVLCATSWAWAKRQEKYQVSVPSASRRITGTV